LPYDIWLDGTPASQQTERNRQSNQRFGKFALNQVQPWCAARGTCAP
jgi:hypothetical protein